jgi:hypothetical protein
MYLPDDAGRSSARESGIVLGRLVLGRTVIA